MNLEVDVIKNYDYQAHRTTSIHRNASKVNPIPQNMEQRRAYTVQSPEEDLGPLDRHAATIVRHMERDENLMEDNPEAEQLRKETIRDMPQCLTVKRNIKNQLSKTVSQKSKRRPLSLFKHLKYRLSMSMKKAKGSFKNFIYSFELWYGTLKKIEGRFGSGVGTYFKFLRWIFLMNCLILVPVMAFVTIPQLLFDSIHEENVIVNDTTTNNSNAYYYTSLRLEEKQLNNISFRFSNIFTGEGYFANTVMYYGFYTNSTKSTFNNFKYSIPYAYLLTMICIYLFTFIILAVRVARSYRKSFIETADGIQNAFAIKIFCGWDFSIATESSATLKSTSLYNELKELLSDAIAPVKNDSFMNKFWTTSIQVVFNVMFVIVLSGIGYLMWILLQENKTIYDDTLDDILSEARSEDHFNVLLTSLVINAIMILFPLFMSVLVKYEDYKNPRVALYITLSRTFLLEIVVIGVLVFFWLTRTNMQCWETSLGQEIYRLILFDFVFSILLAICFELVRNIFHKYFLKKVEQAEFDIARHTLQIIYNQTLFLLGLYFSPLLAVAVVIKLWLTWYIRSLSAIHLCKPSSRSWRAAQTHTFFLLLTFMSLLVVIIIVGYVIIRSETSDCGPFRQYNYTYTMITDDALKLEDGSPFWKVIMVITKPGVVGGILVVMSVFVYYLRAKAQAQRDLVNILRRMLITEAKDKEYILKAIDKESRGRFRIHSQQSRCEMSNPYSSQPDLSVSRTEAGLRQRRRSADCPDPIRSQDVAGYSGDSVFGDVSTPRPSNANNPSQLQMRFASHSSTPSSSNTKINQAIPMSDINVRFNVHR